MTLFSMRGALALLLAASLASCGGGGGTTYPITGTVQGLTYDTLVLTTGTQNVSIKANVGATGTINDVPYTFPQTLKYGDPFLVSLLTNPAHQTCTVGQSVEDSAGHTAVIAVNVLCTNTPHFVSGYITGLTADGLTLINGSSSGTADASLAVVTAAATATAAGTITPSFTFTPVYFGQSYGISILTQPTGQTCTVSNGTGIMGDTDISNIAVTCVANPS